jgi:hypothetical protein
LHAVGSRAFPAARFGTNRRTVFSRIRCRRPFPKPPFAPGGEVIRRFFEKAIYQAARGFLRQRRFVARFLLKGETADDARVQFRPAAIDRLYRPFELKINNLEKTSEALVEPETVLKIGGANDAAAAVRL